MHKAAGIDQGWRPGGVLLHLDCKPATMVRALSAISIAAKSMAPSPGRVKLPSSMESRKLLSAVRASASTAGRTCRFGSLGCQGTGFDPPEVLSRISRCGALAWARSDIKANQAQYFRDDSLAGLQTGL